MYRPNRPQCGDCIERYNARSDAKKRIPPCRKCGKIPLSEDNFEVYGLIEKYTHGYTDSSGGISIQGIRSSLEIEQIPLEDHPVFTAKILSFLQTGLKTSQEKK